VVKPVPLDRDRQRKRGFNQVELIARRLAKRLGMPFRPVLELGLAPKNISWKMKSDGSRYVALLQ
jgi:predicted amidophosphoribosyltransferase